MPGKVTYLDSCVLIAAFQGNHELYEEAIRLLDEEDRKFVISDYVKLETYPKPFTHKRQNELEFMQCIYDNSTHIETSPEVTKNAIELAGNYDLGPMDALHASIAMSGNVDEFITAEKPTKPFSKVDELTIIFLSQLYT